MPNKKVTVETKAMDGFQIELNARNFKMYIDQPEGMGTNIGPTPLEYHLFSLGGCIVTIAKIVAKQRKIDLKGISAKMEADLDTDFLMGKTQEGRAGFTMIKCIVDIDADMTKEEKDAFIKEVDKRCPISDITEHGTKIEIETN